MVPSGMLQFAPMLILDTYNILHAGHTVGIGHIDPARLKEWIGAGRYASEHVVMVYDGHGRSNTLRHAAEPGIAVPSKSSGISELHAGSGLDADSVIELILEHEDRLGRGRLAVVVSSDNRVRAAATAARSRVVGSAAFLKTLIEDLRKLQARADKQAGGRPLHATDEGADPARTEYWLKEFGGAAPVGGESPTSVGSVSTRRDKDSRPPPPEVDLNSIDMEQLLAQRPPSSTEKDRDEGEGHDENEPPAQPKHQKHRQ